MVPFVARTEGVGGGFIGAVDAFHGGLTGVVRPFTLAAVKAGLLAIAGGRLFLVRLDGLTVGSLSSVDLSRFANLAFAAVPAIYPPEGLLCRA